jgi:hypothetical protein
MMGNNRTATNSATTPQLQSEVNGRGVADPTRSL